MSPKASSVLQHEVFTVSTAPLSSVLYATVFLSLVMLLFTAAAWCIVTQKSVSNAFTTNCSLPSETPGYVTGPNVRGTFDILWSCLIILFLCTWTVQHLNVPEYTPYRRKTRIEKIRTGVSEALRKIKWMLATIFAPEFILAKGWHDRMAAENSVKEMSKEEGSENWTLTHAFFANMGGFVLRFNVAAVPTSLKPSRRTTTGLEHTNHLTAWGFGERTYEEQDLAIAAEKERDHCRKICGPSCPHQARRIATSEDQQARRDRQDSGSLPLSDEEKCRIIPTELRLEYSPKAGADMRSPEYTMEKGRREVYAIEPHELQSRTWTLNAGQISIALRQGIISRLPTITEDQIQDRSKGDIVVKATAITQVLWLIAQVIARYSLNYLPSQLEIAVHAFAVCTLITYIIIFKKPQDVRTPDCIDAARTLTRADVAALATNAPDFYVKENWIYGIAVPVLSNAATFGPHGSHALETKNAHFPIDAFPLGVAVGGLAFGSIHCWAWNLEFPTVTEQLLWRIASVVNATLPAVGIAADYLIIRLRTGKWSINRAERPMSKFYLSKAGWIAAFPYVLARLYLMVEMFRSLAFLPPVAFQTVDWSFAIPHVT